MRDANIFNRLADALESDWATLARPNQLPPEGDWWRIWLILAGRGFGKTRTICEFVRAEVERGAVARIAVVAATAADSRDVLVEGPAGLLAISPSWNKPTWEPTKRRLTWRNGAIATCYTADESDRLRGPQHDLAICDELAAWRYPEAFDMLLLGLRMGKNPRVAIATTPRPTKIIRELIAREAKDVVITRGSTLENAANLAPAYIDQILERYRGTRLERQEVFGEVLEDTPGALWTRENLELTRVAEAPAMQRIVVAIDPAGSAEEGADLTGIVVCGLGQDAPHGYVLDDLSGRFTPTEWARRALGAFHTWKADSIICEINYGGAMCAATIAAVDASVPVKTISSSRGKVLRAEPIAAFFAQRRAHIVGSQPELEDQACRFTADWSRTRDGSPDRIDALVFAMTELLLVAPPGGFIKEASLLPRPAVDGSVRPPIEMPAELFGVFAAAAAGVGPDVDALGTIFLGIDIRPGTKNPPLVILDWDIAAIRPDTLESYFNLIFLRLKQLARSSGCVSAGLVMEPQGIGQTFCEQVAVRYGDDSARSVVDPELLAMTLAQRAVAAAGHVHSGHVQISRYAHEKLVSFKAVTRNHLLHQVVAFGVGQQPNEVGVLLAAFSNAVVEIFADRTVRHHLSLSA
jgi:phage terminase large subunit-like protein